MGKREKKKSQAADSDSEEEVTLLDEDKNPTYEFYQCLAELFSRFDVDGDERLSNVELCTFSRAANADSREYTQGELMQIKDVFDWDEGLTLQGWLEMYVAQARNDDEGTWQDLASLGYNSQLELPQVCEGAKFMMTKNVKLQARLEEFVKLAAAPEVDAFVEAIAPSRTLQEEKTSYVQMLQDSNGTHSRNLTADLKCCASGKDVNDIAGDQVNGPVSFTFSSPVAGADGCFCFICEDGCWRVEDIDSMLAFAAPSAAPIAAKTGKKPFGGKRR